MSNKIRRFFLFFQFFSMYWLLIGFNMLWIAYGGLKTLRDVSMPICINSFRTRWHTPLHTSWPSRLCHPQSSKYCSSCFLLSHLPSVKVCFLGDPSSFPHLDPFTSSCSLLLHPLNVVQSTQQNHMMLILLTLLGSNKDPFYSVTNDSQDALDLCSYFTKKWVAKSVTLQCSSSWAVETIAWNQSSAKYTSKTGQ